MITELKPTNLIAVEVPEDVYNYGWIDECFTVDTKSEIDGKVIQKWIVDVDNYICTMSKNERLEILGEVTKDKIGFDVEPYFKEQNFTDSGIEYKRSTTEQLYFLLAENELYFINPYKISSKAYLSFEDKLIKDKLLILEKL